MTRRCRACSAELPYGANRCPTCGMVQAPAISRVWIMVFFVMGILIGLLLLVLEQGGKDPWRLPAQPATPAKSAQLEPRPYSAPKAAKTTDKPVVGKQTTSGKAGSKPAEDETMQQPTIAPLRCDRKAAMQVRERARSLASISEQENRVQLVLTRDWAYYSPGHRRGFVEAFSEADRCLHGQFRELHFLYQGHEVATVSNVGAIRMK